MRRGEFMTRCTRKTTHTIALGSTIGDRPDVQHVQRGVKIHAVTSEPKPIIENGTTLFKSTTVQKTGSGTLYCPT
jgi:hypothetical protein